MRHFEDRIDIIIQALENWFSDSAVLEKAMNDTLDEGLFTKKDIEHSLNWIRKSVSKETLIEWCASLEDIIEENTEKTVLCLHAGNLPLVGIQDIFAVLLSGYNYAGKISKKDPYLIKSFLDTLDDAGFKGKIRSTTDLKTLKELKAELVMYSGSGESAKRVKKILLDQNIARKDSRKLIRTAGFSLAYLERTDDTCLKELAEAILRYEGKGCRSVGVVVSPSQPVSLIKRLEKYMAAYWNENPPKKQLSPKTRYRFAYNKAIGREQNLIRHILIEQNEPDFENDDIIYWVRGDLFTVRKLAQAYLFKLQNIYAVNPKIKLPGFEDHIESLASAQQPPIDWKPDGIDPLKWLVENQSLNFG
ncbi:MAG: hypothetical protein WD267_12045 [Balneolales bacterium]